MVNAYDKRADSQFFRRGLEVRRKAPHLLRLNKVARKENYTGRANVREPGAHISIDFCPVKSDDQKLAEPLAQRSGITHLWLYLRSGPPLVQAFGGRRCGRKASKSVRRARY